MHYAHMNELYMIYHRDSYVILSTSIGLRKTEVLGEKMYFDMLWTATKSAKQPSLAEMS